MKISFKRPPDSDRLFANSGEVVVFWLSVTGLILLAVITVIRTLDINRTRGLFDDMKTEQQVILQRVETLSEQNERLQARNDSLRTEYQKILRRLARPVPALPSKPSLPEISSQEKSRRNFLNSSS